MFSRKKTRDGDREKEAERGNILSLTSTSTHHGGARPESRGEETQAPPADASCASELRLVLLGRKGAGKSSVGNTILGIGEGGFTSGSPTEECVERWGTVAGRRVVIIDTPGWEWYYPLNSTPEWVKWETVRSVTLCPPGPHALLLVVRAYASVDETYRRAIQEHMELLGKEVWKHTLVLFTQGDNPVDLAGRIHKEGTDFRLLVEKCENRWHALGSRTRGRDAAQVVELLQKVEIMVGVNGGAHLAMEQVSVHLERGGRERRPTEERRQQRRLEERKLGESLREIFAGEGCPVTWKEEVRARWPPGHGRCLPDLRMVLLGERETGKSSAGNVILGGALFAAGKVTEDSSSAQAEVAGRLVTVVDTPGWECKRTPERVRQEIRRSVTLCPPGPHALLLVIGVDSDIAVTAAIDHLGLLGQEAWRHALVLFTGGDKLRRGATIEQHIQGSAKAQQLVERCEGRYHLISGVGKLNGNQVTELLEKVEAAVEGNSGQPFTPLIEEIRGLMRRKEERVKDTVEMKKRGVNSRWSFAGRPREREKMEGKSEISWEEVDRRQAETRKLLDKRVKMEIHEMKEKNDRIIAILDQEYKLREGDIKTKNKRKIEEKESEINGLREKNEDMVMKVMTAERDLNQNRRKWDEEKGNMERKNAEDKEGLEKWIEEEKKKNQEQLDQTAVLEREVAELRMTRKRFFETEEELRIIIQNKSAEIMELNHVTQKSKKDFEDLMVEHHKIQGAMDNLIEKNKEKDLILEQMRGCFNEQKMKRETEFKEKIQKCDQDLKELKRMNTDKERELFSVQQMLKDKESKMEELMLTIQVGEQNNEVMKKDFEKKRQQREEAWREETERMKRQMEEARETLERDKQLRAKEIEDLRGNYEMQIREIQTEDKKKQRERENEFRQLEGISREKDKEIQNLKQRFEEELRKIKLQQRVQDENHERDAERRRQTLTETEKQLQAKDRRISELVHRAQEDHKRASEMEKRQRDEWRKREEELEEKIKMREIDLEEMSERCERSERQTAKLEATITELNTENAELTERIHQTAKERDATELQYREEKLQQDEEMKGVVREKDREIKDMKKKLNELQKRNNETEKTVEELKGVIEDREEKIRASRQECEQQKEREGEWKERCGNLQKDMEERKQRDEERMKMRDVEASLVLEEKERWIHELQQKYDEQQRRSVSLQERFETLNQKSDGEIQEIQRRCDSYREKTEEQRKSDEKREMEMRAMEQRLNQQKREFEEMKERNEKKEKELEYLKQHYAEELSKIQREKTLTDEEVEKDARRSRQTLAEAEAQLVLKDRRISELMHQVQEDQKKRETEERFRDELRRREEELEERIKEREKDLEEMREMFEQSRQQTEVMITQLNSENEELKAKIIITERERDEIQYREKEQRREEISGAVKEKDKEIKDMKMELNTLQKNNERKEREVNELRCIIGEKEETITALQQKYEEIQKQLELGERATDELKQKCEETETNFLIIKERYETLSQERDAEIEEIKTVCSKEIQEWRKRAERKEIEIREQRDNYEEQRRKIHIENERKLGEREAEIKEMEAEFRKTAAEAERVKLDLKELQNKSCTKGIEVEEMRGTVEEVEEDIKKYEEGQKEREDMWKEKYEKIVRQIEEDKQTYEDKLEVMEAEMQEKHRCFHELKETYERNEKLLVSIREEYEDAQEQVEKLEELASEREAELKETRKVFEACKKELEQLREAFSVKERGVNGSDPAYPEDLKHEGGIRTWIYGGPERNGQPEEESTRENEADVKQILDPHEKESISNDGWILYDGGRIREVELRVIVREREAVIQELKMTCGKIESRIREMVKAHEMEMNRKESEFCIKLKETEDQLNELQLRYTENEKKMAEMEKMHKSLRDGAERFSATYQEVEADSKDKGEDEYVPERSYDGERGVEVSGEPRSSETIFRNIESYEVEPKQETVELEDGTEAKILEGTTKFAAYPEEMDISNLDPGEICNFTVGSAKKHTVTPDTEGIIKHYVEVEEISQTLVEMDKVVQRECESSRNKTQEEEVIVRKGSQDSTTALHMEAGETEEGEAEDEIKKQEIRQDPSDKGGPGDAMRGKQGEINRPKQRKIKQKEIEASKENNPNLHTDSGHLNHPSPTGEVRAQRTAETEGKHPQEVIEEIQRAMAVQREGGEKRNFQKQMKEISGSGELRQKMKVEVSKSSQRLGPDEPVSVITEDGHKEPPVVVFPTSPLSPESPSQVHTTFPTLLGSPTPSELSLVLLGESWASNTSAGNTILGKQEKATGEGAVRRGQVAGRQIALVEVGGQKWYLGEKPPDNSQHKVTLGLPDPHAFLLVIPAYLSFTASYGEAVRLHMAAYGEQVWKHTLVLFTWAETLGESVERHILRREGLCRLVHRCGNRYHTLRSRRDPKQVAQLLEKVEMMVVANRGGFQSCEEEGEDETEVELDENGEEEGMEGGSE